MSASGIRFPAAPAAQVEHHQGEEKEDHDGPGIDEHLDGRREWRVEQAEQAAQAAKARTRKSALWAGLRETIMATTEPMHRTDRTTKTVQAMESRPIFSFPGR